MQTLLQSNTCENELETDLILHLLSILGPPKIQQLQKYRRAKSGVGVQLARLIEET